jgi:6,7-dimethyl-8-ribityllumazine synthase
MATAGKNLSAYEIGNLPNSAHFRVGIVVSRWNSDITFALRDGALDVFRAAGVPETATFVVEVPGAFELPLGAATLLKARPELDGVVCIGNVIRGETAHFDFVCSGATQGIQRVALDTMKPVMFCVLTDENKEQSIARSGGIHGNKGVECAVACLEMIALQRELLKG